VKKKILYSRAEHRWQYGACALHVGYHTLGICNIYCFSTVTIFDWTRLSVTFYVHCLSCFKIGLLGRDWLQEKVVVCC